MTSFDPSPADFDSIWPIEKAILLACIFEVYAPKVGNVSPYADFADMNHLHFVDSAQAIAKCAAEYKDELVGLTTLRCTQAMWNAVDANTHLGTILLLVPLAKAVDLAREKTIAALRDSVQTVLASLTPDDAHYTYAAIRLTSPGGLGRTKEADIQGDAPECLIEAMRLAPSFDSVARQYTNGFEDVTGWILNELCDCLEAQNSQLSAISHLQLRILALLPDGLIARKCGLEIAREVSRRAEQVRQNTVGEIETPLLANPAWKALDQYLRSDGNRLNPGTTADLIAAVLFIRLCGFKAE